MAAADHGGSLSTILVDTNGDPIGQVIYRCALCRKICDSSSDAMVHYQVDHVELTKKQLQHQASASAYNTASSSHHFQPQQSSNSNARLTHHAALTSTPAHLSQQNRRIASTSSSSSFSLLKRTSSSSTTTTPATSNQSPSSFSLLKRTTNAVGTPTSSNSLLQQTKIDRRPYATTSANRAKKYEYIKKEPSSLKTANKPPEYIRKEIVKEPEKVQETVVDKEFKQDSEKQNGGENLDDTSKSYKLRPRSARKSQFYE